MKMGDWMAVADGKFVNECKLLFIGKFLYDFFANYRT